MVYILFYVTFFYICWQTNESAVRLFLFFFSSSVLLLHSWTRVFWCHRSVFLNTFTPFAMTSCFYQIASKVSNSSEIHSRFSQDILFKKWLHFFFFFLNLSHSVFAHLCPLSAFCAPGFLTVFHSTASALGNWSQPPVWGATYGPFQAQAGSPDRPYQNRQPFPLPANPQTRQWPGIDMPIHPNPWWSLWAAQK